jgi:uncharacterized protein (TIGR02271 family)
MASTQSTVVAVFRNVSDAEAAANELLRNGFSENDIFVSQEGGTGRTSSTTGSTSTTSSGQHEGGIAGWFKRVFGADDEASDRPYYEQAVTSGNVLLSVDTTDQNIDRATSILERHSPVDVHQDATTTGTTGRTGGVGATEAQYAAGTSGVPASQTQQAIPVVEEQIQVGKRNVQRGGVRVYSRVVEQPVEENIRLREERVNVERRPVSREATEADLRPGQDRVIEVKEYGEEPVVAKQARVVEEVRVGKEATETTETVRDKVRHTEVRVENLGAETGAAGSTGRTAATGTTQTGANFDDDFRRHFQTNYGAGGEQYDTYAPAYRYGYEAASDPRYKGKDFRDIESDLRSDYGRRYPGGTWEKMKDSIRYGWDKVTGKASSAGTNR